MSTSPTGAEKYHRSTAELPTITGLTHLLIVGLVLLLSLALVVTGTRMLIAGVASYQAEAFISAWEKARKEPSANAWEIAHGAARRAVNLYPTANGDYLDRLGRVESWKQFLHPYADPAARSSRLAALAAYRGAVAARPTWPHTWVLLAYSKVYLQEFDSEFDHAFTTAFELGPWRLTVNQRLAEIGLNVWPQLTQQQSLTALESARRTAANSPIETRKLLQIAELNGRRQIFCGSLSTALKTVRNICL